jgi:phosphoribosylpyrophosphate synthetase
MGFELKLIAGNSNVQLARGISNYLGVPLVDALVGKFADSEIGVQINENIRGADMFVIQSTCPPVNDNLMELLIIIDALRRELPQSFLITGMPVRTGKCSQGFPSALNWWLTCLPLPVPTGF